MRNFINWLKNIHFAGRPESAKRFYGAIGYITSIIYIALWDHDSIVILLYVSAGLLGLEAVTKIFIRNKFGKGTDINNTSDVNNDVQAENQEAVPTEEESNQVDQKI